MHESNSFIRWNERQQRFEVDWRKTLSIVVGELLLQEILAVRPYLKGYLPDVGCGSRPCAPICRPLVELSVEFTAKTHRRDAESTESYIRDVSAYSASRR